MTKFEVIKAINGLKEFSNLTFDLVKIANSPEKLQEILSEELTEEGLRTIQSVARLGNYPLSFDDKQ